MTEIMTVEQSKIIINTLQGLSQRIKIKTFSEYDQQQTFFDNIIQGLLLSGEEALSAKRVVNMVRDLCETWEKYSGQWYYPVSAQNDISPDTQQHRASITNTMYDGVYGELQVELIDFLLVQLNSNQ